MRKLTIRLDNDEYAALEERARQERRTVRDLAAYLVTRPPSLWDVPVTPWMPAPANPPTTPTVVTDRTSGGCMACCNPGAQSLRHTCLGNWQTISSAVQASTTPAEAGGLLGAS